MCTRQILTVLMVGICGLAVAEIECFDYTIVGGYNLGSEKIMCKQGQSCYNMAAMHGNTSLIRSGGCVHNTLCTVTFADESCQIAEIGGVKMRFCCCQSADACKWDPKVKGFLHRGIDWVKSKLGLHSSEETEEDRELRPEVENQVIEQVYSTPEVVRELEPDDVHADDVLLKAADPEIEAVPKRAAVEKVDVSRDVKRRRYKGVDLD